MPVCSSFLPPSFFPHALFFPERKIHSSVAGYTLEFELSTAVQCLIESVSKVYVSILYRRFFAASALHTRRWNRWLIAQLVSTVTSDRTRRNAWTDVIDFQTRYQNPWLSLSFSFPCSVNLEYPFDNWANQEPRRTASLLDADGNVGREKPVCNRIVPWFVRSLEIFLFFFFLSPPPPSLSLSLSFHRCLLTCDLEKGLKDSRDKWSVIFRKFVKLWIGDCCWLWYHFISYHV